MCDPLLQPFFEKILCKLFVIIVSQYTMCSVRTTEINVSLFAAFPDTRWVRTAVQTANQGYVMYHLISHSCNLVC